jgi:hypothetical protein
MVMSMKSILVYGGDEILEFPTLTKDLVIIDIEWEN